MPDRNGSLSNFPTSLDQFVIKTPYDSSKALGQQALSSLEQAAHINTMFDAAYNIESYLLSGSGGAGGSIVTRWSSGVTNSGLDVYGPNLKLGYTTITVTMTGDTVTVTGSIASAYFGTNPFYNKGFAMAHNFYVTDTSTEGIWANQDWGPAGPFNQMIKWHQFFTLIRPLTGTIFEATIRNFPFHSSGESISSTFTDNMSLVSNVLWQNIYNRAGWTGSGKDGIYALPTVGGQTYWVGISEEQNGPRYGWAYPTRLGQMTDSYVEWGEIVEKFATPESGSECYTRVGPMVRATGTMNSASFYCVAIGDIPRTAGLSRDLHMHGRILKVQGANLANEGAASPDGGGTAWPVGTITYFGTGSTSSSGYFWFGEENTRYRLKCETVTGSAKVTVQSSPSPYSVWSDIYGPFYDGVSPLTSGFSGVFSQAMNGDDDRWVKFLGGVTVSNLNSSTSLTGQLQLAYMLISPEANITMESGS